MIFKSLRFTSILLYLTILFASSKSSVLAQETFPVNGIANKVHTTYAFTNATVFVDYKRKIDKATLIIKDDVILECGISATIPKDAVVIDLKGKFIYPSFIDAFTSYGIVEPKRERTNSQQIESNTKGAFAWNQAIKSETDASKIFVANATQAEELRKLGFGAVHTFNHDGIARGAGIVVSLADINENQSIIKTNVSANYSFDKGSSTQDYPNSLMGCIALIRQTNLDAEWYKNVGFKEQKNISLESWNTSQSLPQIFEANGKYNALRADRIGDEFKTQYIIKSNGDEYQRADEIKQTKATFIIPLNYPATPDIEDPYDASMLDLDDMKHWELAPYNLSILEKKNINFCITTSDLKSKDSFLSNLRKAIKNGLSDTTALKALTKTPATILNMNDKIGSLEKGKLANFIITSGQVFDDKTTLYENWIQGKRYIQKNIEQPNLNGIYSVTGLLKVPIKLRVIGAAAKYKAETRLDTTKISVSIIVNRSFVNASFTYKKVVYQLTGNINVDAQQNITGISGTYNDTLGNRRNWFASYSKDTASTNENKKDSIAENVAMPTITYPLMAYGFKEIPKVEMVLIKNTTVWTNENEGVLKETDVLIENGKIAQVGKNISASNAKIIDGKDKHLTAGIIDEHSHIAVSSSVNESSQSSTAEVRIGDVINADDINIYRQLSGGVVASQLLHGSANAIGGQSALVKLRWGAAPEKMKIEGVDGFIKFALGENVKQSNWGDKYSVRYPQTRMGVEQVYYDAFTRAKEYDAAIKSNKNTRRDLDLEALAEIINKKRFITCHSYQQGEINMLMHVADSFHFRVNTFTHILEGYKVADKMKAHGVGASTFSDWWAYKFEVMEAIPYNAALMTKMGITVAINSDDAEMGRRLNQEAAKSIKYGGLTEEEALKMVTLNPAKLLHLDNKMGSIKVGKDADVVLWNNNPLSIYAKPEKTFVDGILYFDAERDVQLRKEIAAERQRIIQKMIVAKRVGDITEKPKQKVHKLMHCDD